MKFDESGEVEVDSREERGPNNNSNRRDEEGNDGFSDYGGVWVLEG